MSTLTSILYSNKRLHHLLNPWVIITTLLTVLFLGPLLHLLLYFFNTTLPLTFLTIPLVFSVTGMTLFIALSVAVISSIIGIGFGWLTVAFSFPGRSFFSWALLLPMAIPNYVFAFVMLGLFDFSGPIQQLSLQLFGVGVLPPIRNSFGYIMVLSLSLYPYMYLFARQAFLSQGQAYLDVATSLGYSRFETFKKVILPAARPWIGGALVLIVMEVFADFGAASIFNIDTFTTVIYKLWFGYFSLPDAARLSSGLLLGGLLFLYLEKSYRKKMRFSQHFFHTSIKPVPLSHSAGRFACSVCGLFFVLAVVFPIGQLIVWTMDSFSFSTLIPVLSAFSNTLWVSCFAACLIITVALLYAFTKRVFNSPLTRFLSTIATLGYALPGTVLAVALFSFVAFFERSFLSSSVLNYSFITLLFAYLVRFMMPAFQSIHSGFERISGQVDEIATQLKASSTRLLVKIHLPLIKSGLATGFLIVMVDIIKEMPITLMTRPFGWDTLSVRIFNLTAEGLWAEAALPSLILVLIGLVPVLLLTKQQLYQTGQKGVQ